MRLIENMVAAKTFYVVIVVCIACLASIQAQNLILNPGCEDTLINGEIPAWTEITGSSWTQRTSGNPPAFEGAYMFFPGAVAHGELQQDIDVSFLAAPIDNNTQVFNFTGYVRVFSQIPADRSRIILEYLDVLKTAKLDSFDSGIYTNTSAWSMVSDTNLAPAGTRFIRIRLISTRRNGTNNDGYYDGLSLTAAAPANIEHEDRITLSKPYLEQNYPNPFNPTTMIFFTATRPGPIRIEVYNILGQRLETLLDRQISAGRHQVIFNARDLPGGIYFYRIRSGTFSDMKKMVLLK